jgi:uncharacterized repeat protein (TIGR03803 family)
MDFQSMLRCAIVIAALAPSASSAHTLTTLYRFSGGADGGAPAHGVIAVNGTLYGTSIVGAARKNICYGECGTVFAFNLATEQETVIYGFNGRHGGVEPNGVAAFNGMLYGTTADELGGMLFSFDPIKHTFTDLHSLRRYNPTKGQTPNSSIVMSGSALYGTTAAGGLFENGVVFKFRWKEKRWDVLHDFARGNDGRTPVGVTLQSGMLYGATQIGGGSPNCFSHTGCGTIFSVDPKTGAEKILHTFVSTPDGAYPNTVVSVHGVLYGSSSSGGRNNYGTLFRTDPRTGATTILYSFPGGVLGSAASSPLSYHDGALYGTTSFFNGQSPQNCNNNGGVCGTIFKYDLATGEEKTLYAFDGGKNGGIPEGGLTWYEGAFYGTTRIGNGMPGCDGYQCGTIFKFVP